MKLRHNQKRSGMVMLLALLIMAAITASTIAVSLVISSTTRQSKNLDNFIIASLSADTGIERSLAVVKASRTTTDIATAVIKAAAALTPETANGSSFSVTAIENAAPLTVPLLKAGQSFSFDLLKTPSGFPPKDIVVRGGAVTEGTDGNAILDISWVLIDANGNTNYSGRQTQSYSTYTAPSPIDLTFVTSETTSVPAFSGSTNNLGYRITVRARDGSVYNVQITTPAALPSSIAITSTGQAGSSRSVKQASILWQPPSSKLFNYVLFTEGQIVPCGSIESAGC